MSPAIAAPRPATVACLLAIALGAADWPALASAEAFRGARASAMDRSDLLDELEQALGSGRRSAMEGRVAQFEDAMRPIFRSLPRTSDDRLPASGVRYLLHRVFVTRHGWFVEGLTAGGDAWNSSSPAAFFAEHAGEDTEVAFERRLIGKGLTLHECAVFAAALENLVHEETSERLRAAYQVAGLDADADDASEHDVERAIDAYMVMFVVGLNHTAVDRQKVMRVWDNIRRVYPTWDATHKWVREVRREVVSADPTSRTAFATTTNVLEEVADRYGRWQDSECIELKEDLMKLEKDGTGRVPLQKFYSAALNGSWQFKEKPDYLRQLGALDESTPSWPSVIIPNYINAASNCLASSKFYSVCCINECEALLSPIERHIAAPDALPQRIVELVERLPSSTVDAPRRLPTALVLRLEDIAAKHGGRVPIHGRLFAQWMHNVYPRECPFPHLSGMTKQMTGSQYRQATKGTTSLDSAGLRAEVESYSVAAPAEPLEAGSGARGAELHWCDAEELFVQVPHASGRSPFKFIVRVAMMMAAACSLGLLLLRSAAEARGSGGGALSKEKCFV